jgi:hypothetical protein
MPNYAEKFILPIFYYFLYKENEKERLYNFDLYFLLLLFIKYLNFYP